MNRTVIALIEAEYQRYKILGERSFAQLDPEQLVAGSRHASSIATIVWHVAGNLESRFTDFLTTDGEKPWRNRESEFEPQDISPSEGDAFVANVTRFPDWQAMQQRAAAEWARHRLGLD